MAIEQMKNNIFKLLDVTHHVTSGLKSLYSQMALDCMDVCRFACGGAGYSAHSHLPDIYLDYSPNPVYEGDSTVLAQ